MTLDDRHPVRSYQRIFRPERRIYQVEGHRLPVPGGVPLRWLGYAVGSLLAVIVLSTRSPLLGLLLAAGATAAGLALGGRASALIAGAATFGAGQVLGYMLVTVDWPLRLLVLPALVATLATQATPDGRAAHRYARSWIALQLRPERRTLGRSLPPSGESSLGGSLAVARDECGGLRRGRVRGPALVELDVPVEVSESRLRGRRRRWARLRPGRARQEAKQRVQLRDGERLEVRP